MTSRRAGGEGSNRGPPSPSSSGSEDNGFVNRPRVVGLYVKNLSREELDSLAEEGIYGPTGDPSTSRRGLNLDPGAGLSSSSSSSTSPTSSLAFSGTRSRRGHREVRKRRVEEPGNAREADRHRIPMDERREESRSSPEPEDHCHGRRSPSQISNEEDTSTKHSEDDSSRLSPSGYEVFDQEDSSERTIRQCAEDSEPEIVLEIDLAREIEDAERKTPQRSPEFTGMFTRCGARVQSLSRDSRVEEEEPLDDLKSDEVESKCRFRSQDSTRLRPPLVGTAGTSADSGTGDSASAEIQVDTLGTPQITEVLEETEGIYVETCSPGAKSPGTVDGHSGGSVCGSGVSGPVRAKQCVKPFTKESLERLESRTVQLVREYGFQPRRKTSVEDGAVLPHKFEPFPSDLYGRPLEEIDNFIYDEVGKNFND